jgi:hypothetical protein
VIGDRRNRAQLREWVLACCPMATPRLVCSDAERRFAVWAHDDLRARGHKAWVETVWIRPQRVGGVAVGCALTAIGGLVALGAPAAGLALTAVGALSLLVDAAGRAGPLRRLFPRRATQVVLVAPAGDPGAAARTRAIGHPAPGAEPGGGALQDAAGGDDAAVELYLVARTDVPRGGLASRLAAVRGGMWWLGVAALGVVAAAAARVGGVDGTALGAAQLVPTVVLLVAATVALDVPAAASGDGEAEAEAVHAALAAHEALVRDPPPGVAVGVLLGGPEAVRVHLRRERLDPVRTALLRVRAGPVRSRHHQWGAAAEAAGLQLRGGGPRGVPSAEAPPDAAEPLARALGGVLS